MSYERRESKMHAELIQYTDRSITLHHQDLFMSTRPSKPKQYNHASDQISALICSSVWRSIFPPLTLGPIMPSSTPSLLSCCHMLIARSALGRTDAPSLPQQMVDDVACNFWHNRRQPWGWDRAPHRSKGFPRLKSQCLHVNCLPNEPLLGSTVSHMLAGHAQTLL